MISKKKFSILGIILLLSVSGCMSEREMESQIATENSSEELDVTQNMQDEQVEIEKAALTYQDLYEEAFDNNAIGSLEVTKSIVERLGDNGYAAVDDQNEIDMVNTEQVEDFCLAVDQKEEASLTIFRVTEEGGLLCYQLNSKEGDVDVTVFLLTWSEKEGQSGMETQVNEEEEFEACYWEYTDYGYLLIEQYHPAGYDGPSGHIGIRVSPLNETCREYNREYVEPIGYYANNMLITDWSEEDYGDLDFYDMYEIMYQMKNGYPLGYEANILGDTYEILQEDFESVIQTYFKIDKSVLRQKTVYLEADESYQYRPRTLYDSCTPDEPSPEVIGYQDNEDGTITLTVNAIWIRENKTTALVSELTIRPLEDGGVQYVSNHVVTWGENVEATWYGARLTEEQWEEVFGQ